MTAQELQDPDNVVLYAKPTLVIDAQLGQIDGSAFIWNGRGDGLSVNWLECFGNLPKERQLDIIRQLIRLQMRHSSAPPASAEPDDNPVLLRVPDLHQHQVQHHSFLL